MDSVRPQTLPPRLCLSKQPSQHVVVGGTSQGVCCPLLTPRVTWPRSVWFCVCRLTSLCEGLCKLVSTLHTSAQTPIPKQQWEGMQAGVGSGTQPLPSQGLSSSSSGCPISPMELGMELRLQKVSTGVSTSEREVWGC